MASQLHDVQDPVAPHSLSPAELKQLLAALRAGEALLAMRDDGGHLLLSLLSAARPTTTLGRRPEMDVALPWDGEVSSLHAELELLGGEWTIVDDGLSTNGTYVNGVRVGARQRLRDGDRIRVGRTVLVFRAVSSTREQTTIASAQPASLPKLTDTQRRVLIALCRPYQDAGSFATPASNREIAGELFLTVDAVKMHLRSLFARFELTGLPQNQKRARLAECALRLGLVTQRDLG
ncbi:MAG TPA: FHA domain-containing protein [Solirubrobacteraceae bacterium]|nr:FHA domain-containing protein [Solirubrobacteraceae bacterium]